jgi:hypothetical protein
LRYHIYIYIYMTNAFKFPEYVTHFLFFDINVIKLCLILFFYSHIYKSMSFLACLPPVLHAACHICAAISICPCYFFPIHLHLSPIQPGRDFTAMQHLLDIVPSLCLLYSIIFQFNQIQNVTIRNVDSETLCVWF